MNGTVLVLYGIATSRIMLKVQLSAAYYHVVQSEDMAGLLPLVRRSKPDLIVASMSLPGGGALAVREVLGCEDETARIPILAIAPQNDRAARLLALRAGIDDVLNHPLDDTMLQARIRNLIRTRNGAEGLHGGLGIPGLSEPAGTFRRPARVTLLTRDDATRAIWQAGLADLLPHSIHAHDRRDIVGLTNAPPTDAFVVEIADTDDHAGLNLVSELRARAATCDAAVIPVLGRAGSGSAADALDRGAHDVMQGEFDAEELALRLDAQLRRKARSDHLRASVRSGLQAAIHDPMTGLFNRRHALPHLAHLLDRARKTGSQVAVMLADLDHFKTVNDRFGHPAGDAVLVEAATRLQCLLRPADMIARIGGEEFLIVMPDTGEAAAGVAASRLCREISRTPVILSGFGRPVGISISIGVVVSPRGNIAVTPGELIDQADRALYRAKDGGRNMVRLIRAAA